MSVIVMFYTLFRYSHREKPLQQERCRIKINFFSMYIVELDMDSEQPVDAERHGFYWLGTGVYRVLERIRD